MDNIALCLSPTEGGVLSLLSRRFLLEPVASNTSKCTEYNIIFGAISLFIISVSVFSLFSSFKLIFSFFFLLGPSECFNWEQSTVPLALIPPLHLITLRHSSPCTRQVCLSGILFPAAWNCILSLANAAKQSSSPILLTSRHTIGLHLRPALLL